MKSVPFKRVLHKGMHGGDVRAMQRGLIKAGFRKNGPTGEFHELTRLQVIHFQRHHGIKNDQGIVRSNTWSALQPYFDAYDLYLVDQVHVPMPIVDKLDKFVSVAWWYYYRRPFGYTQQRPMTDTAPPPNRDSSLDCSEFVYVCAQAAGLPDPSGYIPGYQGYGNTDSYLAHMRHVASSAVRTGDLSFYANPGHVGIVVGWSDRYKDHMVIEHGHSGGPEYTYMNYRPPVAFTTFRTK